MEGSCKCGHGVMNHSVYALQCLYDGCQCKRFTSSENIRPSEMVKIRREFKEEYDRMYNAAKAEVKSVRAALGDQVGALKQSLQLEIWDNGRLRERQDAMTEHIKSLSEAVTKLRLALRIYGACDGCGARWEEKTGGEHTEACPNRARNLPGLSPEVGQVSEGTRT